MERMFTQKSAKTFELADLVGRCLWLAKLSDEEVELIAAKDLKTGEIFILSETILPKPVLEATTS